MMKVISGNNWMIFFRPSGAKYVFVHSFQGALLNIRQIIFAIYQVGIEGTRRSVSLRFMRIQNRISNKE